MGCLGFGIWLVVIPQLHRHFRPSMRTYQFGAAFGLVWLPGTVAAFWHLLQRKEELSGEKEVGNLLNALWILFCIHQVLGSLMPAQT
jgi:hypothetical protein